MSPCLYTRKVDSGYEYGHMHITDLGSKNEKRKHIAHGVSPTLDEALKANGMKLKGQPRIGVAIEAAFTWNDR